MFKTLLCGTAVVVAAAGVARADVQITDFNVFFENELYASWKSPSAVIDSGLTSYTVTATGYGSNYTYIGNLGILGAGNTHVDLDVTLSGPPAADGFLGPIITLVDADGSNYNFAWFGQTLGQHNLTMAVTSPTWIGAAGTTPGLDLSNLLHMHMQLDPGQYGSSGPYTVSFNNLSLITIAGTPGDFNSNGKVDGGDFLIWQRGGSPAPGSSADLEAWKSHYGASASLATVSLVPEPSGVALITAFAAVGAARRWRMTAFSPA